MIANRRNPFLSAPAEAGKASGGSPAAGAAAAADPASDKGEGKGGEGDEEDEDGDEGGESDDGDESPEPEAAEKLEMSAGRRAGLYLKGKGFLIGQIAAGYEEINDLRGEVSRLQGENARLRAAAKAGAGRETKLANQVAKAAAEKTTISAEVRKELTSLGVSEAAAPAQLAPDQTPDGLLETFNGLTGSAKIAFFRKHQQALKAADAAASKSK